MTDLKKIKEKRMINNPRIIDYIDSLHSYNSDLCEKIRDEALLNDVPIIKRDTEALLKNLLYIKRPNRILEVGTAVAYSTIVMAETLPFESYITTIEKFEPRIEEAKKNIGMSGFESRITLIAKDAKLALEELASLNSKFDFVFMDAAKAQYIKWLPSVISLLEDKGIIFSDNILQDGDILESRYVIDRRDRTIHSRMREYLYELTHNDKLHTSLIPIGDGVALSVLK